MQQILGDLLLKPHLRGELLIVCVPCGGDNEAINKNTVSSKEDKTMTTNTNYRTIEMEELEIVSGGTVTEFDELITAIEGNGVFGDICGAIGGHVPGANNIVAAVVKNALEYILDIRAEISLGFAGTGIGSDPNIYIDLKTGKMISHAEVIDRIRRYGI